MNADKLSIDDFLKKQATSALRATVESVEGKEDVVKVTPWVPQSGCLCHLAVILPKQSLEGVILTGETHPCCGTVHKVVEVHFKEGETLQLKELFAQLSASAASATSHSHAHHAAAANIEAAYPTQGYPDQSRLGGVDCLTRYFTCISNPPPGVDFISWACECRNLSRICEHQPPILCPAPRH